jgi:uncharacterized membrane protein YcgQ (UPF0703/DUF1980 family)
MTSDSVQAIYVIIVELFLRIPVRKKLFVKSVGMSGVTKKWLITQVNSLSLKASKSTQLLSLISITFFLRCHVQGVEFSFRRTEVVTTCIVEDVSMNSVGFVSDRTTGTIIANSYFAHSGTFQPLELCSLLGFCWIRKSFLSLTCYFKSNGSFFTICQLYFWLISTLLPIHCIYLRLEK